MHTDTLTVWALLLLELFQTASTTYHAWVYTIADWGDNSKLQTHPWSAVAVPFTAELLGWIVQSFYAWRIWVLAPNTILKVYSVIISILSMTQWIIMGVTSIIFATNLTSPELEKLGNEFTVSLSISSVVDVLIAIGMIVVLRRERNENLSLKTDNILKRLIIMAIGTGSLLAVFGLATTILFAAAEGRATFQYQPGVYTLGKLYSNSAMVTLNARKGFRHTGLVDTMGQPTVGPLQFRDSTTDGCGFEGNDLINDTAQSTESHHIHVPLESLESAAELVDPRNSKFAVV
ncbi:hypothetical protein PENSPDRAFT_90655 [Peniophora sp. CONT]|nr:hypothetical protein PENSPDRAFT_90655 [Peniophora sp. CONT]